MLLLETWLHPLRAYPRGFVLACFAVTLGALIFMTAKALKWSIYTMGMLTFAGLTGGFALWLWQ